MKLLTVLGRFARRRREPPQRPARGCFDSSALGPAAPARRVVLLGAGARAVPEAASLAGLLPRSEAKKNQTRAPVCSLLVATSGVSPSCPAVVRGAAPAAPGPRSAPASSCARAAATKPPVLGWVPGTTSPVDPGTSGFGPAGRWCEPEVLRSVVGSCEPSSYRQGFLLFKPALNLTCNLKLYSPMVKEKKINCYSDTRGLSWINRKQRIF